MFKLTYVNRAWKRDSFVVKAKNVKELIIEIEKFADNYSQKDDGNDWGLIIEHVKGEL